MINWIKSAELNNTTSEELESHLDKYPKSNKRIIRICDDCCEEKEISFDSYCPLCHKCAVSTLNNRKLLSESAIKRFEDPNERKSASDRAIERCSDPEVRKKMSEAMLQYHIDHPEAAIEHSKFISDRNNTEEWKSAHSEFMMEYCSDPEVRKKMSEIMIQYRKDHPDAYKDAIEKQKGGNDICKHHYIYDHASPEKYTMEITRSKHTYIHNLMRKAEIIVPHINEDTG